MEIAGPKKNEEPFLGFGEKKTQWPSTEITTKEEETGLTTALTEVLRYLTAVLRAPTTAMRPVIPTFEGVEWENPRKFLETIEGICQRERIPYVNWTRYAADQLRGRAYGWYAD